MPGYEISCGVCDVTYSSLCNMWPVGQLVGVGSKTPFSSYGFLWGPFCVNLLTPLSTGRKRKCGTTREGLRKVSLLWRLYHRYKSLLSCFGSSLLPKSWILRFHLQSQLQGQREQLQHVLHDNESVSLTFQSKHKRSFDHGGEFVFLFEQSAKKRKSVLSSSTQETTQERENGEVRWRNEQNEAQSVSAHPFRQTITPLPPHMWIGTLMGTTHSVKVFTAFPRRLFNSHFVPQNTSMLFSCSNLLQFWSKQVVWVHRTKILLKPPMQKTPEPQHRISCMTTNTEAHENHKRTASYQRGLEPTRSG